MPRIYRIGDMIQSRNLNDGFQRVNLAPYLRVKPGMIDLSREQVIKKAMNFQYLDSDTNLPSLQVERRDEYMINLGYFWNQPNVKLNLKLSYYEGNPCGGFGSIKPWLSAMYIECKDSPLERDDGIAKWEGFLEVNNFWPLFATQFDDSSQRVDGLYIDPLGTFVIKYKDLKAIDRDIFIHTAYIFGILQNIKTIDYKLN